MLAMAHACSMHASILCMFDHAAWALTMTPCLQIGNVLRAGSATGLSALSTELEVVGLSIHTAYGALNELPFSAYGCAQAASTTRRTLSSSRMGASAQLHGHPSTFSGACMQQPLVATHPHAPSTILTLRMRTLWKQTVCCHQPPMAHAAPCMQPRTTCR
jgi:hypothetical protein